jgi:Flp pilus assembly protein TadD
MMTRQVEQRRGNVASRRSRHARAAVLSIAACAAVVTTLATPGDPEEDAARKRDDEFVALFQRGQRLMGRGADEEAEKLFRKLLTERPDQGSVHHALGLLLQFRRRHVEATDELLEAARLAPEDAVIQRDAGLALVAAGRAAQGEPYLANACRLWPDDVEAAVGRGAALRALGRPRDAENEYRRAVAVEANSVDAAVGLAACVVATRPDEALRLVEKTTGRWPDVLLVRGLALARLGREDEAKAPLVEAARVVPPGADGAQYLRGAAEALVLCGHAKDALVAASQWRDVEETDDSRACLALARAATGDHAGALSALDEISSARRVKVGLLRGVLLLRLGRAAEAKAAWTALADADVDAFDRAAARRLIGRLPAEEFAAFAVGERANDRAWVESLAAELAGDAALAAKHAARAAELSKPRGEFPGVLLLAPAPK